jgi:hypothetical protein
MVADNIKTICVRLNLDKPIHRKAYDLLKQQTEFSNSQAIAIAVADYFENKNLADRIVAAVKESLMGFVPNSSTTVPQNVLTQSDELANVEIDFDFLGG